MLECCAEEQKHIAEVPKDRFSKLDWPLPLVVQLALILPCLVVVHDVLEVVFLLLDNLVQFLVEELLGLAEDGRGV